MGLCGKEMATMPIKCNGKLIFDLLAYCPNYISKLSPTIVQSCDVVEGQSGTIGSIVSWAFTIDGKKSTAKEIISAIDEEKKLIQFKVIEGDVLQAYKSFLITVQTTNNSVTISIEFEKMNEGIPNPSSFTQCFGKLIKDIDFNHQAIPRLATN